MRHLCDVMCGDVITHIQQKSPTTETKKPHNETLVQCGVKRYDYTHETKETLK